MKGQSEEEKQRLLKIAGQPKNGQILPIKSMPNAYRVLQRTYTYDKTIKRSRNDIKTIGIIVNDEYMSRAQYHQKYTSRGRLRFVTKTMAQRGSGSSPDAEAIFRAVRSGTVCQRMLGACPVLYRTAVNIGLTDDLTAAYGDTVAREIMSLAFHRIIDRDNAARRFTRFAAMFALPFPGIPSEQELADLYVALGRDETGLSRLFTARCARLPDGARINYDSTSIPTTAADIGLRKISKRKEGIFGPMMHLSLLADQATGLPILYRLFAGNIPDSSTVGDLLKCIAELAPAGKRLCLVFDRGYETMKTLCACTAAEQAVLMAVRDLRQDFVQQTIDAFSDFWDAATCLPGTAIHGHTRKFTVTERGQQMTLWVHVFRDDGKSKAETAGLMREVDEFEDAWKQADFARRCELTGASAYKYFTGGAGAGELHRNRDVINAAARNFGFFASVSTVEMTAAEALSIYGQRDRIEKCFKAGKLNVNLDVVRAHWQETMKGRFVVGFVSLLLLAELGRQLGREQAFSDRRLKPVPAKAFTLTDVLDLTQGVGAGYAVNTGAFWHQNTIGDLNRLCTACGTPGVYDGVPEYLSSGADLCTR